MKLRYLSLNIILLIKMDILNKKIMKITSKTGSKYKK